MKTPPSNLSEFLNSRTDKFLNKGMFEVIFLEGEFKAIGLKWGESKRLKGLGFKKDEQIFLLNQIETDIKNKLICPYCFSRKIKAIDYKEFYIICESCGEYLENRKNEVKGGIV